MSMANNRQPDPNLSDSENRRLLEMERQLRTSDPELEQALRTGRREEGTLDPVQAALVAMIGTPLILLATFLGGPMVGAVAAGIAVLVLVVRVLTTRRTSKDGPSAYR